MATPNWKGTGYTLHTAEDSPYGRDGKGIKYDDDKNPLELLSPFSVQNLGLVLKYGAKKYDKDNWMKGMEWRRVAGAALRHIFSWLGREDLDPETKLSHIDHAQACLHFLSHYISQDVGTDDRAESASQSSSKEGTATYVYPIVVMSKDNKEDVKLQGHTEVEDLALRAWMNDVQRDVQQNSPQEDRIR